MENDKIVPAFCGRCVDPSAKRLGKVRASTKKACEKFVEAGAEESANE